MTTREMTFSHFYGRARQRQEQNPRLAEAHPDDDFVDVRGPGSATHRYVLDDRPDTIVQALMQCAPGDVPETSKEELAALRPILVDAIDALPDRDRYIFDRLIIERVSLRALSKQLGLSKTHLQRERVRITRVLQQELLQHPLITYYLDR